MNHQSTNLVTGEFKLRTKIKNIPNSPPGNSTNSVTPVPGKTDYSIEHITREVLWYKMKNVSYLTNENPNKSGFW